MYYSGGSPVLVVTPSGVSYALMNGHPGNSYSTIGESWWPIAWKKNGSQLKSSNYYYVGSSIYYFYLNSTFSGLTLKWVSENESNTSEIYTSEIYTSEINNLVLNSSITYDNNFLCDSSGKETEYYLKDGFDKCGNGKINFSKSTENGFEYYGDGTIYYIGFAFSINGIRIYTRGVSYGSQSFNEPYYLKIDV